MLNDLRKFLHTSYVINLDGEILRADDLVLISDSLTGLQELKSLFTFCSQYQMTANDLKTMVMIYGKQGRNFSFYFNNTKIEIVNE